MPIVLTESDTLELPSMTRIVPDDIRSLLMTCSTAKSSFHIVSSNLKPYYDTLKNVGVKTLDKADIIQCLKNEKWISDLPIPKLICLYQFLCSEKFEDLKDCRIFLLQNDSFAAHDEKQPVFLPANVSGLPKYGNVDHKILSSRLDLSEDLIHWMKAVRIQHFRVITLIIFRV